eukprot:GFYU01006501.1.p1 GENE.GFYU01006501.1~~GFYU01006501.1.p1  ORF type:complete len:797 (+),score=151.13 GFYU01006501.1:140-2392(+)
MALFEILDFGLQTETGPGGTIDRGFYRICWGFLKLVGGNGEANTEKQVRLQLYRYITPNKNLPREPNVPKVYGEYRRGARHRRKYPAALYVTLKSKKRDNVTAAAAAGGGRARTYTKLEADLRKSVEELNEGPEQTVVTHADDSSDEETNLKVAARRRRLAGQTPQIPDHLLHRIDVGPKGCTALRFSHEGRYLACAVADGLMYAIQITSTTFARVKRKLPGHHDIIYEISWNKTDDEIVSASKDCTAKVWAARRTKAPVLNADGSVASEEDNDAAEDEDEDEDDVGNGEEDNTTRRRKSKRQSQSAPPTTVTDSYEPLAVFHHPCFVYTAKFVPGQRLVATGAYDFMVRIWDCATSDVLCEMPGHMSHVNSLVFSKSGDKMFTADGIGVIKLWVVAVKPDKTVDCNAIKDVAHRELANQTINCISLNYNDRRLLVLSRDNMIRGIELRSFGIVHRYSGLKCFSSPVKCCYSPEGKYVLAGSEDGRFYIWNADYGHLVLKGGDWGVSAPILDVSWHSREHVIAFSGYGSYTPVILLQYEKDVVTMDKEAEEARRVAEEEARRMDDMRMADAMRQQQLRDEMDHLDKLRFEILESLRVPGKPVAQFTNPSFQPAMHAAQSTGGDRDRDRNAPLNASFTPQQQNLLQSGPGSSAAPSPSNTNLTLSQQNLAAHSGHAELSVPGQGGTQASGKHRNPFSGMMKRLSFHSKGRSRQNTEEGSSPNLSPLTTPRQITSPSLTPRTPRAPSISELN